ncbi:MAG: phosphoenolpyruvate--protein phosphotransferase [Alphaproteobacteria bacterium]|nr:phosphoenolpyruvate--protein phosphotransferase [Alphaproteobacteria bacterium]
MRRLRDVMSGGGDAQQRLDRIVHLIAAEMVAEVCSIYIRRSGNVLELFATEGLKQDAVHKTRLAVGEGLVGDIARHARPLALADAQIHPAFAYRPETGEEIYHSMLGVPVIRGGRVLGVVVVQNRTLRAYSDEEIETMETVAMVLAELVASGGLELPEETGTVNGFAAKPLRLQGLRLSDGLAIGHARLLLPHLDVDRLFANDMGVERERLNQALAAVQEQIDGLAALIETAGPESRDILEAYGMFARDTGWRERILEAINSGLTAEAAVSKVQEDIRRRMSAVSDHYLRERMQDFDDLANRLLKQLIGGEPIEADFDAPEDAILVARSLGPADLLDFPRQRLRAVLLEQGSPTAHVAIVARALEIPVVGDLKGLLGVIEPNDEVIVDADNGQVFLRPGGAVRDTFARSMATRRRQQETYAQMRDLPAETRDGASLSLSLNAGLLIDLPQLTVTGADGIGLYRTELPFMVRSDFPDVDAQCDLYRRVLDQADGKPVVFRTLDIGGDKPLPYFEGGPSENPALGWRALRIGLDQPAMLQRQIRALIRAGAGRVMRIMFPMVAEVAEFETARDIVRDELSIAESAGQPLPETVQIGVMLEVPALVWQMPALLDRVDFVSVGSNDLVQFVFASDRSDPRMADRYDALSPAVLSLLRQIAQQCRDQDIPLSICGEIAGRPLEAMALIAIGYRALSMPASAIGPVKAMVRSLDLGRVESEVLGLLTRPDHSVRHALRSLAVAHGVHI